MCGRAYETYTEEELLVRYINDMSKRKPLGIRPNYNFSPTQNSPIVYVSDDGPSISLFRWGLVPSWAKSIKDASKYSLINARSEDILEKRTYKAAFLRRRCILPLSGFIEWKRNEDGSKRPFAIYLKDRSIMSVAGIWERWTDPDGESHVDSFSALTVRANSFMAGIHDRMPVILARSIESEWLDPNNSDPNSLKSFLKPCPSTWLNAHEISTKINSPKNNSPDLLKRLN